MRRFHRFLLLLLVASGARAQELHFKPRDHRLGDVHPLFHEGECYLYYLKPGNYESALARSTDWWQWTETPLSHDGVRAEDWMRPYFVLGVFRDAAAGLYRSFYGYADGRMASSVSTDLLHWSCAPKAFQVPPGDYYQRRRDPFVFWIPERKEYGCVMTTWMKNRPKETGGAVSLATSPDLKTWQDHGPILDPGTIGEPECPQMFSLGGRWYLLASIYREAVGRPVYWSSASPLGPWNQESDGVLDGKDLCAAQIAFSGNTPILFGWIPLQPARPGSQTWGGHLALPREVYALPDGKLGVRLPAKILKRFEQLPWQPTLIEGNRLVAEVTLGAPNHDTQAGLRIARLGEVIFERDRLRVVDESGACWSEVPMASPSAQPLSVRLVLDDDIVEVFVDDRYALAARLPARPGPKRLSVNEAELKSVRSSNWLPGTAARSR